MKNGIQYQLKVTVIGARQVGKSALTVRYLTRRYIGEYKSNSDLSYRQVFCLDGSSVEVELVDVSNHPEDTSVATSRAKTSDACVLVYSISDRSSFRAAREALSDLYQEQQQSPTDDTSRTENTITNNDTNRNRKESQSSEKSITSCNHQRSAPIVLLGNKKDLAHLRQVETAEGRELASQYGCVFREVSAAEADQSPTEDLAGIFNQLIREARTYKIHRQDANNNANSDGGGGGGNNGSRQRKRSVFTINRMFGSLIGRNSSMPPELPSSRKANASQIGSSMPNVAGSFRSVFKKRSV